MPASLRKIDIGPLGLTVTPGADGAIYAHSPFTLAAYDSKVTDWLDRWAARDPQRLFLAERVAGDWRGLTYGEVRTKVRALAEALLGRGLGPERPLVILSGNRIAHALLGLAALYVGIPYAPISPSHASHDFGRLKRAVALLTPGLAFIEDGRRYQEAITAAVPEDIEILALEAPSGGRARDFALFAQPATPAVDAAHESVSPETIAKFMFTSGSTGTPKAVVTTQRMLCANQAMITSYLRFLGNEPPIVVDWLPWHHSFGGNQNFNLVLCHGGTLYIDAGRPTPEGIETTLANLRGLAPTIHFNVPHGLDALLPHLARDAELAESFFSRLKLTFLAGAPISRRLIEQFEEIALRTCGERICIMSGYGATETSPAALFCRRLSASSVGLPLPGTELKLVTLGEKREARIKGPHITPGYWRQEDLNRRAFDEEGYYRLGDALRLVPEAGFCLDGRLDEDFKLATGTWVSVGPLRQRFIEACAPYVKDLAIAGAGEAYIVALVFPNIEACRELAGFLEPAKILAHSAVLAKFRTLLGAFSRKACGSSDHIAKIALVPEPSMQGGEMTDKGALNQAAVLARRAAVIRDLYAGNLALPIIEAGERPAARITAQP